MNDKIKNLQNYKIFKGLSHEDIELFNSKIEKQKFNINDKIIEEKKDGDSLLFLIKGNISITKSLTLLENKNLDDSDNIEKEFTRLKAENNIVMGEVSLFSDKKKRTATVTALSDCMIGFLSNKDFFNICNSNYEVGYKVIYNLTNIITENLIKENRNVLKLTTAFSLVMKK